MLLFVGSCEVKAINTSANFRDFELPISSGMCDYNGTSPFNCIGGRYVWETGIEYESYIYGTYNYANNGTILTICTEHSFLTNHYYQFSFAIGQFSSQYNYTFELPNKSIWTSPILSTKPTAYASFKTGNWNAEVVRDAVVWNDNFVDVSVISFDFIPNRNGTKCISVNINTNKPANNINPILFGFKLNDTGTQYNEQFNDVNNNINSSKDEIIANQDKNHQEAEQTRKGILETIKDLPQTIVNFFIEGLKSLFLPTEEQINEVLKKSSALAENFGFIGQSVDFMINIFSSFVLVPQSKGCVTLPNLTISFSKAKNLNMSDYTFWEEQDVCLDDHPWIGKVEVITVIRTILTISLVILFLRFAIKEFDYLLSKDNSNGGGKE